MPEPKVRTIEESQRIFAETGHLVAPLLDSFYAQAAKSGEPFEIVTPGYYDKPRKVQPPKARRPFWKFW